MASTGRGAFYINTVRGTACDEDTQFEVQGMPLQGVPAYHDFLLASALVPLEEFTYTRGFRDVPAGAPPAAAPSPFEPL
jgi:hypothetical protein